MFKNVLNQYSLLLLFVIVGLSACSSPKRYSRGTSYNTKVVKQKKKRTYTKSKSSAQTTRLKIVSTAKKYIGKSYTYGGKKPSTGFDCSGFTSHVFKNNGINLSGASHQQAKLGKRKSKRDLEEGDLVFFGSNNRVSHVAIVADVGHNKIKVIHSTSSRGVVIDNISTSEYWSKRYLFGRDVLN